MKGGDVVLALGELLLVAGLVAAVITEKSPRRQAVGRVWSKSYLGLLVFALASTVALLLATFIERVFVDAYRVLLDFLALGLVAVFLNGLILVVRCRGFLVSYVLTLCGAFLTFGEFLGQ